MILTVKFAKTKNNFDKIFKKAATNALAKTGYEILEQAHYLAPIDHGTLVGSGYVQVGKNLQFNPIGAEASDEAPPIPDNSDIKELELRVGYSVPYSSQLHDNKFYPGVKSIDKGLFYPGYKWLWNKAKKMKIKEIFKEYLSDELE